MLSGALSRLLREVWLIWWYIFFWGAEVSGEGFGVGDQGRGLACDSGLHDGCFGGEGALLDVIWKGFSKWWANCRLCPLIQ